MKAEDKETTQVIDEYNKKFGEPIPLGYQYPTSHQEFIKLLRYCIDTNSPLTD